MRRPIYFIVETSPEAGHSESIAEPRTFIRDDMGVVKAIIQRTLLSRGSIMIRDNEDALHVVDSWDGEKTLSFPLWDGGWLKVEAHTP